MAQGPSLGPYGVAVRSALERGHVHPEVLQHILTTADYICSLGQKLADHLQVHIPAPPDPIGTEWWADLLALDRPRRDPEDEERDDYDQALEELLARARTGVGGSDDAGIRSLSPEIPLVV